MLNKWTAQKRVHLEKINIGRTLPAQALAAGLFKGIKVLKTVNPRIIRLL